MKIKDIQQLEPRARALSYCQDEEKPLSRAFSWGETIEGLDYWRNVERGNPVASYPENVEIKEIEDPELKTIALDRKKEAGDRYKHSTDFRIKFMFAWSGTPEGFYFWQMVSRGAIRTYDHPLKIMTKEPKTIGQRLKKAMPFVLEKNGKILYKEDRNGDWVRKKYNDNGKLILFKKSTGKLWRASNN